VTGPVLLVLANSSPITGHCCVALELYESSHNLLVQRQLLMLSRHAALAVYAVTLRGVNLSPYDLSIVDSVCVYTEADGLSFS